MVDLDDTVDKIAGLLAGDEASEDEKDQRRATVREVLNAATASGLLVMTTIQLDKLRNKFVEGCMEELTRSERRRAKHNGHINKSELAKARRDLEVARKFCDRLKPLIVSIPDGPPPADQEAAG